MARVFDRNVVAEEAIGHLDAFIDAYFVVEETGGDLRPEACQIVLALLPEDRHKAQVEAGQVDAAVCAASAA